jgi:hypothetical protein
VLRYVSTWLQRIAFQACAIDHSAISPFKINDLRAAWIRIAQNPPSGISDLRCRTVPMGYGDAREVVDIQLCQTF